VGVRLGPAALGVLALGWASVSSAAPSNDGSTCVSCHLEEEAGLTEGVLEADGALRVEFAFSAPTHEWQESIHALHEVSCDGCHGGDPHEPDEELSMSEEAGFLENPSWTEMGEFCGVCHEAVAASYAGGVFGRAMDEGVRVATCDTCHMSDGHRILVSQPEEILATARCPGCLPVTDADDLLRSLAELRALHAALAMRVGGVEARGLELADVADELVVLRASIASVVHTFEPSAIRHADAEARDRYRVLDARAEAAEGQLAERRRTGLVLLGALALLFVALLGWDRTQRGAR
jgi:hypothetical protein